MAVEEVEALKKARKTFVQARRRWVARMNAPPGSPSATPEDPLALAAQFSAMQAAIEALDRAIKDEGGLPPGAY
jgi:hypothetical protein